MRLPLRQMTSGEVAGCPAPPSNPIRAWRGAQALEAGASHGPGELVALRWRDVDFAGQTIRVRGNYSHGDASAPRRRYAAACKRAGLRPLPWLSATAGVRGEGQSVQEAPYVLVARM